MDDVDRPFLPPIDPMRAKAQAKLPDEAGVWSYEPKWDGFRALVFRDGDDVILQSRSGKDLGRYFPELLDALRNASPRPNPGSAGWPSRRPRTSSDSMRWRPARSPYSTNRSESGGRC